MLSFLFTLPSVLSAGQVGQTERLGPRSPPEFTQPDVGDARQGLQRPSNRATHVQQTPAGFETANQTSAHTPWSLPRRFRVVTFVSVPTRERESPSFPGRRAGW